MSLPHGLLGLLNYKAMTGYELSKAFDDSLSFFWKAQTSQIYRELNRMEEKGWLTSKIQLQTEKPNKRIYSITAKGKATLKSWLSEALPPEFLPAKNEILIRLFFLAQNPAKDNVKKLQAVISSYESQLASIQASTEIIASYSPLAKGEDDPLYWELAEDFGRMYAEMCIKWAKSSIEKIKQSTQGGAL